MDQPRLRAPTIRAWKTYRLFGSIGIFFHFIPISWKIIRAGDSGIEFHGCFRVKNARDDTLDFSVILERGKSIASAQISCASPPGRPLISLLSPITAPEQPKKLDGIERGTHCLIVPNHRFRPSSHPSTHARVWTILTPDENLEYNDFLIW